MIEMHAVNKIQRRMASCAPKQLRSKNFSLPPQVKLNAKHQNHTKENRSHRECASMKQAGFS